jgi:DNA-binding NarL/FixJ family response regulator
MRSLLLVEDDARLAAAVARSLETSRGWRTCIVASAAAALEAPAGYDLAIVDLGLPDRDGTAVIAELARRTPSLPAVAFTLFDDRATVLGAVDAGAVGYILKEEPLERVVTQLEECFEGGTPISSRVARYLFELGRVAPSHTALTHREEELLACLSRGYTYDECAASLGVKLGTVQSHVKNLYRKLEVTTKTEAAAWATRHRRP